MALPTSSDGTVRFEFVALSFRLWRDIDLRNGLCRTMETLIVVTLFVPGTGPVPCKKVRALTRSWCPTCRAG
jgi:hypothetical protein